MGLTKSFRHKKNIRWRSFLDWLLSHEWAKFQQTYFDWSDSRKSGNKWVATLIQKLYDVEWEAWEDCIKILHDTTIAGIMSRALSLDRSVRTEWTLGFHRFPNVVKAVLSKDIGRVIESSLIDKIDGLY